MAAIFAGYSRPHRLLTAEHTGTEQIVRCAGVGIKCAHEQVPEGCAGIYGAPDAMSLHSSVRAVFGMYSPAATPQVLRVAGRPKLGMSFGRGRGYALDLDRATKPSGDVVEYRKERLHSRTVARIVAELRGP